MTTSRHRPAKLIVAFSGEDRALKDELLTQLAVLRSIGMIEPWDADEIRPGDVSHTAVDTAIADADVVLLLLSANFLATKLADTELNHIFDRWQKDGLRAIPILLKTCPWKRHPWIGRLNPLPKDGKAIAAHVDDQRAAALTEVVDEIAKCIDELHRDPSTSAPYVADAQAMDDSEPPSRGRRSMLDAGTEVSKIRQALILARTNEEVRLCLHNIAVLLNVFPNSVEARVLRDEVVKALMRGDRHQGHVTAPQLTLWQRTTAVAALASLFISLLFAVRVTYWGPASAGASGGAGGSTTSTTTALTTTATESTDTTTESTTKTESTTDKFVGEEFTVSASCKSNDGSYRLLVSLSDAAQSRTQNILTLDCSPDGSQRSVRVRSSRYGSGKFNIGGSLVARHNGVVLRSGRISVEESECVLDGPPGSGTVNVVIPGDCRFELR